MRSGVTARNLMNQESMQRRQVPANTLYIEDEKPMEFDHLMDCEECKKITIKVKRREKGVVACVDCGVKGATIGVARDGSMLVLEEQPYFISFEELRGRKYNVGNANLLAAMDAWQAEEDREIFQNIHDELMDLKVGFALWVEEEK